MGTSYCDVCTYETNRTNGCCDSCGHVESPIKTIYVTVWASYNGSHLEFHSTKVVEDGGELITVEFLTTTEGMAALSELESMANKSFGDRSDSPIDKFREFGDNHHYKRIS